VIGLDGFIKQLENIQPKTTNYPPYNLLKTSEDSFRIEVAVAGFSKEDLNLTVEKKILTVVGEKSEDIKKDEDTKEYLYHGISSKNFKIHYTLSEYVYVDTVTLKDGLLVIDLIRKIPDEEKPKQLLIK
jgi:molecular chaperone IbpA